MLVPAVCGVGAEREDGEAADEADGEAVLARAASTRSRGRVEHLVPSPGAAQVPARSSMDRWYRNAPMG